MDGPRRGAGRARFPAGVGVGGRAVLKGAVRDGCARLAGRLVARGGVPRRRAFVALRSACGDGLHDPGAEGCDGADARACPGACRDDCACPGSTGSTTTTTLPGAAPGLYAVTETNVLLRLDSAAPGAPLASTPVSGLAAGETVGGLDFRPATGGLYALGVTAGTTDTIRLYRLDPETAVATPVGGVVSGLVHGVEYGLDFNPATDRLRVINDGDENLRLDPDSGARADTPADGDLSPAGRLIRGIAHASGAAGPTLYGLCFLTDELVRIGAANSPNAGNSGAIIGIGGFAVSVGAGSSGFDVHPGTGVAWASLRASPAALTGLYTIDRQTGVATLVGPIGDGTVRVPSLAVR